MPSIFEIIDASDNYLSRMLKDPEHWRRRIASIMLASMALWLVLGFDSTWEMVDPLISRILHDPESVVRALGSPFGADSAAIRGEMWSMYGLGNHWSAPVIYGFAFLAVSRHLESQGIGRSMNFFFTTSLSLGTIGVFELAWNACYSRFQDQLWAFSFIPPQVKNMAFFSAFTAMGVFALAVLLLSGYKPKSGGRLALYSAAALALWLLWISYPFPVQQIQVQTDWGLWTSSRLFPQTFYAVDVHDDGLASGAAFYVQNDWIHLVNVLCKVFTTAALVQLCLVEKR